MISTSLQRSAGYSTHSPATQPAGELGHVAPTLALPAQRQLTFHRAELTTVCQVSHLRRVPASLPMERGTSAVTPHVNDTPTGNSWPKSLPVPGHPQVAVSCSPHTMWAGQCDHGLRKPE